MSRSVIEKVIGRAAATTPGVSASSVRGVKGWFQPTATTEVATQLQHTPQGPAVTLDVCLDYPSPIRDVVDRLRHRVTAAAHQQLGIDLDRIDVVVTQLRAPDRRPLAGRRVS